KLKTAELNKELKKSIQAKQALKESEERFRIMFEQAAVGVAYINSNTGEFVRVNQRYSDIVGYTVDEMQATTFQKITYPDDLQEDLDNMERLRKGEIGEFSMEKRYFRKNSDVVWVNLTVSPLWKPGEQPSYHVAIVEDITDRKNAEDALLVSKKKYRDFIEGTDDLVTRVDGEGNFIYVNHMAEKVLGVKPDDCIGKSTFSFIHPDDIEVTTSWFNEIVNNKKSRGSIENRQISKDGKVTHVLWNSTFHYDEDGNVLFVDGIARDITERQQFEEKLSKSETFIKAVLDNLPIGIAVNSVDPTVDFDYMNDNFPKFYRTTREKLAESDAFWTAVFKDPEYREYISKRVLD
ncbi:hypothetical protein LCGC14_3081540, partial [marine sediment metagenome]